MDKLLITLLAIVVTGCATTGSMSLNSDGSVQRTSYTDNRVAPKVDNGPNFFQRNPKFTVILFAIVGSAANSFNETVANQTYFPNSAANGYNVVHSANELSGAGNSRRSEMAEMLTQGFKAADERSNQNGN